MPRSPGGETRTPVHIDLEVYEAIRRLAKDDDRTITRYINRVLQKHIEENNNK